MNLQIPLIKTDTVVKQFKKIKSEYDECKAEFEKMGSYIERAKITSENEFSKEMQMEALDHLTAAFNLVNIINISQETINDFVAKMKSYETDPKRMYEIIKWVKLEEVNL